MRALGEPDAFPTGDIGLLHALGLTDSRELERRSQAWRPWRAYAAMYLWNVPDAAEPAKEKKASARSKSFPVALKAMNSVRPAARNDRTLRT